MKAPAFLFFALLSLLMSMKVAVAELVVAGRRTVSFYQESSGELLRVSGASTEGFYGLTLGPDGNLYVAGNILGTGTIYRFSPDGRLLGEFAGEQLRRPGNLAFGPDGNLYAIGIDETADGSAQGYVIRYNGITGAFIDYFIRAEPGATFADLVFARDGNLYIADRAKGIVRHNARTGSFRDVFIPTAVPGALQSVAFGPDGHLYVAQSYGSNAVERFDGRTGAFLAGLVTMGSGGLTEPTGMAFGPDGHIYIGNRWNHSILKFAGDTGASLGTFASPGSTLRYPSRIVFMPRLTVQPNQNSLTIRWPAAYTNLQLMCKTGLTPGAQWMPVTASPQVMGNDCVLTQPSAGAGCFFRLEPRVP